MKRLIVHLHGERMRHDSRRNRDEVISAAMRVKSNKDRMPPMRRYEIINRLWTRYLVPLRDMIDTQITPISCAACRSTRRRPCRRGWPNRLPGRRPGKPQNG